MSLLFFAILGSAIGALAHSVTSGGRALGGLMTTWLGIAGALLGALLASFVTLHRVTEFHTPVFIGSIAGAFGILACGGVFRRGVVAPASKRSKARPLTLERVRTMANE